MKRMHLHVSVPDLARSIAFYETLFGAAPVVVKDDYADRKSTRLNSSHVTTSRMPSSA